MEKLAEQYIDARVAKILGQELPIDLNATHTYPTISSAQLPGGAFHGVHTEAVNLPLNQPMPSGDFEIPVVAFCSEYSMHRPGQGVIHKLGPLEGRLAAPVAELLRQGLAQGRSPRELQNVSWAIQAGVPYAKMPSQYQQVIDLVLPEYKPQLQGSWTDKVEAEYNTGAGLYNTAVHLFPHAPPAPSLTIVLTRLGAPGHLMLDALAQQKIILAHYDNDAQRNATLFGQQGSVEDGNSVAEGPWTVIKEGRVYARLIVKSGNLQSDNLLQVRIMPKAHLGQTAMYLDPKPHLQLSSYVQISLPTQTQEPKTDGVSLSSILRGPVNDAASTMMIAYSQGQGTQALALALPNGKHPCNDPDLPAAYDQNHNWHYYETRSLICSSRDTPGCTRNLVYEAMLATPSAIAPTYPAGQQVTACGVLTLLPGPEENRVRTYLDEPDYKVINFTLPQHIFYPGQIERQIDQTADGSIYVHTIGFGNGSHRCLNVVGGSELIWPTADDRLCDAVSERMPKGKGRTGKTPVLACKNHSHSQGVGGTGDSTVATLFGDCALFEDENN